MKQEKIAQLKSILNKLEDVKHTQESVIDKVNHVITDLFQHPDKKLEKAMEDAHQRSSDNIDTVSDIIEELEMRINKAENES